MRNRGLSSALLALGLAVAACASSPESERINPMTRFDAGVEKCKQTYGYDPDAPPDLGEHALAPNERQTRACVYDAIRTTVIPLTAIPQQYEALIATDRRCAIASS